ncbi:MAG: DNA methyltransferase [Anaerolineae bacterium]
MINGKGINNLMMGNCSLGSLEKRYMCPLCNEYYSELGTHLRQIHGEEAFRNAVLTAKENGMADAEIGARYGISFNMLQQIITEHYGANISVLKHLKRINRWTPRDFQAETTTVWSFEQRGDWATHNGRYRGNWSPYIPRNIILRYSQPGDVVLDYFVGGGTTAVEAKLLGRRCIARDINPGAIGITLENLRFTPLSSYLDNIGLVMYEPEVSTGDARDLSDIPDNSVDLICAHPPYAGIIKYSTKIPGDLSSLSVRGFLVEMNTVARESFRVLKPGGKCAILIGDARKEKCVVPIGFQTIRVFLDAGFILKELVIKRQHHCKTTGFWYTRSVQYNFLLLAHEYLPIFEKPRADQISEQLSFWTYAMPFQEVIEPVPAVEPERIETTTVWIFPPDCFEAEIRRNLQRRFAVPGSSFVEILLNGEQSGRQIEAISNAHLVYIAPPNMVENASTIAAYRAAVQSIANTAAQILPVGGHLVLDTRDIRLRESLWPMGLLVWESLLDQTRLAIREIIVAVPEKNKMRQAVISEFLDITHRYLLVYTKKEGKKEKKKAC